MPFGRGSFGLCEGAIRARNRLSLPKIPYGLWRSARTVDRSVLGDPKVVRASRRDVTIFGRGDQVLDRGHQSRRRYARTGRLIVEHTRTLAAAPGMKPTRRDTQEPRERSQREVLGAHPRGAGFAACRVRPEYALPRGETRTFAAGPARVGAVP